jgi:hypothetical protein
MILLSTMLTRMKIKPLIFQHGQFVDNVGILEYVLELEQMNMNLLEVIQHSRTGLVWYNPEYER